MADQQDEELVCQVLEDLTPVPCMKVLADLGGTFCLKPQGHKDQCVARYDFRGHYGSRVLQTIGPLEVGHAEYTEAGRFLSQMPSLQHVLKQMQSLKEAEAILEEIERRKTSG